MGLTDINYYAHSGAISCDNPNPFKEIIKHPHRAGRPTAQPQQWLWEQHSEMQRHLGRGDHHTLRKRDNTHRQAHLSVLICAKELNMAGTWGYLPPLSPTLCPVCPKQSEQHCWSYQTYSESCWLPSSSETLRRNRHKTCGQEHRANMKASSLSLTSTLRAYLRVAARLCVPSPPTEGWCQSYWQAPPSLSDLLRYPS